MVDEKMGRPVPKPSTYVDTAPFWEGAKNGKLVLQYCKDTGRFQHYPRPVSIFTGSRNLEWREVSGKGTIYTYSVMRRAKEPYAIAYVTLAEGPTMMTNLVDCDFDALRVGQPVNVVFKDTENGPPVPMFKPA